MKKKVIFFYGINLLVTLTCAMVFGGVLGSIQGNEMLLGLIVTMGVQLAPGITSWIYRKKYKIEKKYTWKISKWTILAVLLPVGVVFLSSILLSLCHISYIPTAYTGGILAVAILTTILGCTAEEFGWRGCLQEIWEEKYSPFLSSILTGVLWGVWHFFKISSVGILGYLLFIPSIVLFSVLMGYIFYKSNRSITNMIAFHCFINFTTILLLYERESIWFYISLCVVSLLALGIIWLRDKEYFRIKGKKD